MITPDDFRAAANGKSEKIVCEGKLVTDPCRLLPATTKPVEEKVDFFKEALVLLKKAIPVLSLGCEMAGRDERAWDLMFVEAEIEEFLKRVEATQKKRRR